MVGAGDNLFGSQFLITLDDDLGHLDGDNRVFGEVADGLEILDKFNEVIVDETHRPFQVINGRVGVITRSSHKLANKPAPEEIQG